MSRLVVAAVCLPSIFEVCVIAYAALRTRQFFVLWVALALITSAKFALKYVYLLRLGEHEKRD